MRQIEKTAKTYEEALESALKELNASISEVDVLTLEEGSKGLFGLFGSRPYKIRVTLKQSEADEADELDVKSLLAGDKADRKPELKVERKPPAKLDRRSDPRPDRRNEPKTDPKPAPETKAEPAAEENAPAAEPAPEKKSARRPEPVRRVNPDRKTEAAPAAEEPAEPAEQPDEAPAAGEGEAPAHKRRRRHRGHGGSKKQTAAPEGEENAESRPLPPKQPVQPMEKPVVTMIAGEELDPESPAGRAKAFLQELTHLMGVDVTIEMGTDPDGNVYGYMNGDTLGILIGRRGETLDALQYLTSLRVNRGSDSYTRVTLDTENYRAKREDTLIRLANRKANHAVKTGRRVALEPMNPYERRIVHSALQANEAVETHSEGEEPNRHVVITVRKA